MFRKLPEHEDPACLEQFIQPEQGGFPAPRSTSYEENDEPQPQVLVALGFLMTNWEPWRPSE